MGQFASGGSQFGGFSGTGTYINGLTFVTGIGAGLGGISTITRLGITTRNDAGAAGRVPLTYDPTNNRIGIGTATPNFDIGIEITGGAVIGIDNGVIYQQQTAGSWALIKDAGGVTQLILTNDAGLLLTGHILPKGVSVMDDEFTNVSWGATGTVGANWLSTIGGGGSILRVAGARGGIVTLNAATGTRTYLSQDGVLQVQLQDAPRLYSRWQSGETVTTLKCVGWCDNPAAVNDAVEIVVDTAVGNNYYLRGVRGAAVTNKDTGVAVDTNFHVFEIVSTSAGVVTGYIDGTAVGGGLTAAQCPVVTTTMQPFIKSEPLGAPAGNLSIDVFKSVQSRNTGVAP